MRETPQRYLIVNADDFGLSHGTNRGIIRAHDQGIVTSASLMVRQPAAEEAAALAQRHARLSVGMHVDLGEWVYRDGGWVANYEVVSLGDTRAVSDEVERQLETFERLMGRLPTHLDSHQHVHRAEPARGVLRVLSERFAISLRHENPAIRYCGDFYGQTGRGEPIHDLIRAASLVSIVESLPAGVTELACHPGLDRDCGSVYCAEREMEVQALCDPTVRSAIEHGNIELIGFEAVAKCGK
ncbi:MAG TPA: ChbG/HpnK family deacetylase [Tepidisphaeraceae bacterium]|jgi:predicted glycoside hydrolase/deacetylase ChbG (UPF0249 family)|nr:ChbG/HpnK family deacetylase [Tepidisphaeraceae bacterium]